MAEEKKMTQAQAKSVADWVSGYYGDDAIDMSKANKIKHLIKTGQFASVVYVVSKNTKLAHTDLSESNYSAIDTTYAKAAELIIRLLHKKYKDGNRPLTAADFEDCGGRTLFGHLSNYDQVCDDYIRQGGMVDTAQSALPVYATDEGNAKCYGGIVDDLRDVMQDHTHLLAVSGAKDGVLERDQIFNLYDTTTDVSTKIWKKLKDAKSGGEFELQKQMEEAYLLKYDLAKKSAKMGLVGAGAVYALGAMAGGLIFVPAIVALGSYALGKKWLPDWFKSAGAMWGSVEKRYQKKREIKRAVAHMDWLVRYVEKGGKPRTTLSDLRYVRKQDIDVLKKQAKTLGFSSIELKDGKTHKGILHEAKEGAARLGNLMSGRDKNNMVPADIVDQLEKRISAINADSAKISEFNDLAFDMKTDLEALASADKRKILALYSDKLMKSAKALVFQTNFETGTDYQDKIANFLSEEYPIMSILKDFDPNTVEKVKRYVTFASKELTGLGGSYIGGTLENYITRDYPKRLAMDKTSEANKWKLSIGDTIYDFNVPADETGLSDAQKDQLKILKNVFDMIDKMKLDPDDDRVFVSKGTFSRKDSSGNQVDVVEECGVPQITKEIAKITDDEIRSRCSEAMNKQMSTITFAKSRSDSKAIYESILTGGFGGKLNLTELFGKFKDVSYDNIETFSKFYDDMGKMEPKEARYYIRGKLAKQVYDEMKGYAGQHMNRFKSDLKAIAEYLKKVNGCHYLNEYQKMELSSLVGDCVQKAFDSKYTDLTETFMHEEGGYNTNDFSGYLKGYEFGGLKELFESDQSSKMVALRENIEYMRDMQDVYNTLKMNGQYKLDKDDAKYIALTLLSNRATGDEPLIRKNDDPLRQFITTTISGMDTVFTKDVVPVNGVVDKDAIKESLPHQQLEIALNNVLSWDVTKTGGSIDKKKLYDQYTALVILKNKAVSLFRGFMKTVVSIGSSGQTRSGWISSNITPIDEIKDVWGHAHVDDSGNIPSDIQPDDGILLKIDKAMADSKFNDIIKASKNTARSELGKYGTSEEIESMLSQQQL